MPATHRLGTSDVTFGWNRTHRPLLTVNSGDVVEIDAPDCSNGQICASATLADFSAMDMAQLDPISGPIHVRGAEPGDVVQVDILRVAVADFGWSAVYKGVGLLQEEFPDEWFHVWDLSDGLAAELVPGVRVPLEPMLGIVGCTPDSAVTLDAVPPHRCGGNMDMQFARAGSTLFLPVQIDGAGVGIGDPHAAQGDGEVGGSGIETPARITVRLTLLKRRVLRFPVFEVAGPLERPRAETAGYYGATGIGPDPYGAAQDALRGMIDLIVAPYGLEPVQAYMLCSVAGDLRISEVVNQGTHVVSCVLPKDLFTDPVSLLTQDRET